VLCIESARRSLGWSPKVDFEEGVERFAAWMKRELAAQSLLAIGGYSG
jgi:UDP-glucose 4-epimerase